MCIKYCCIPTEGKILVRWRETTSWKSFIQYFFRKLLKSLITVLFFVYFGYLSLIAPLNFDEAYNLQIPINLIKGNGYKTIYKIGQHDEFTIITTGPTVLIPISVSFMAFGVGKIQARIIPFFYLLSLIAILRIVVRKNLGSSVSEIILVVLFYSMHQFELSLYVLGEIPALFFLILGLTFYTYGLPKHSNLAFIVMGLSVVTKFYFLFSLLPILVVIFWYDKQVLGLQELIKKLVSSSIYFCIPSLFFEVFKFLVLGARGYYMHLLDFARFAANQNLPMNSLISDPHYGNFILTKLMILKAMLPSAPVMLTWGIIIFTSFVSVIWLFQRRNLLMSFFFLIFFEYLIWFIFIDSTGWWRRIYPFSIMFLCLLLYTIMVAISCLRESLPKKLFLFLGLFLLARWIIPSTISQYHQTSGYYRSSIAQQEFARVVKSYKENGYQVGVYGWWQAPEISFLSGGLKFKKFECEKKYPKNFLVIYTKLQESMSPKEAEAVKKCLDQVIEASPDHSYFLYSIKKSN